RRSTPGGRSSRHSTCSSTCSDTDMSTVEKPRTLHRFVTGHDEHGKSVFLSSGPPPQHHDRQQGLVQFFEIWRTSASPAPITAVEPSEPIEPLPLPLPPA